MSEFILLFILTSFESAHKYLILTDDIDIDGTDSIGSNDYEIIHPNVIVSYFTILKYVKILLI